MSATPAGRVNLKHLAHLEAAMLWPGDGAARRRLVATRRADFAAALLAQFPLTVVLDLAAGAGAEDLRCPCAMVASDQIPDVVQIAREAPSWKQIDREVRWAHVRGIISGRILRETLGRAVAPCAKPASIESTMKEIAGAIAPRARISFKTISATIWPSYRRVAHYWAAYLHRGAGEFPCQLDDLDNFLALAEAFRSAGEGTRTHQSPTSLLRRGEAFRFPPGRDRSPKWTWLRGLASSSPVHSRELSLNLVKTSPL
jgi:hypothetical protein